MEVEVLNDCYTAKDEAGPILSIYIREVTLPEGGYDERTVCEITSIQQYGRTQTEANQAVKLLFDHLFEEFDDFPYIPDDLDDEEKAPIAFLLENGYLSKKHLLDGEDEFAEPDFSYEPQFSEAEIKKIIKGAVPGGIPPEIANELFEVMKESFLTGERPESILERIMGGKKKKAGRK